MREIKFRFWYSLGMTYELKGNHPVDLCHPFGRGLRIMQYTGLKDKNGKEIYESDIITHSRDGGLAEIIWNEDQACFDICWDDEHDTLPTEMYYHERWEVIGNIYENPELLG
jgi:uncharacterized phage protein (TIGR01671 family)